MATRCLNSSPSSFYRDSVFTTQLLLDCLKYSCPELGTVYDAGQYMGIESAWLQISPFMGSYFFPVVNLQFFRVCSLFVSIFSRFGLYPLKPCENLCTRHTYITQQSQCQRKSLHLLLNRRAGGRWRVHNITYCHGAVPTVGMMNEETISKSISPVFLGGSCQRKRLTAGCWVKAVL